MSIVLELLLFLGGLMCGAACIGRMCHEEGEDFD